MTRSRMNDFLYCSQYWTQRSDDLVGFVVLIVPLEFMFVYFSLEIPIIKSVFAIFNS